MLRFSLDNNMRGGSSPCMGNRRHVKPGERETVYEHMTNLFDWSMSQFLPKGDLYEVELTKKNEWNSFKTVFRTLDRNNCEVLKECDWEYPSNILEKSKDFSVLRDKQTNKVEDFSLFMKEKNQKSLNLPKTWILIKQTNKVVSYLIEVQFSI